MSKCCGTVRCITLLLVIIGAINWGLVGAFEFNLVSYLFTDLISAEIVERIIYVLVGISGLVVAGTSCKSKA